MTVINKDESSRPINMSDVFMERCRDYVETHRDALEANPDDAFVQRIMKEVIDEFRQ